jgi:azurin
MRTLFFIAALCACGLAQAQNCNVDLTTGDQIKYDQRSVTVSSTCPTITVTLTHAGRLPAQTMGHNVVIAGADTYQAVARDGMQAGLAGNYVKAGDARVIASTKVIGGGESATTSFPGSALKAGGAYKFFCTAPGHLALMTGALIVQ